MSKSLNRVVAALVLTALLASPATAQQTDLPDVAQIRQSVDLSVTFPLELQKASAAAEDKGFFNSFPSFSTITRQIAHN